MLHVRLTRPVLAATLVLLAAACTSVDGSDRGAIREAVVEPAVTVLDRSRPATCDADIRILRTALDAYEVLEGEPARDETALVDAGLLRAGSALWDVADGEVIAVAGSGC